MIAVVVGYVVWREGEAPRYATLKAAMASTEETDRTSQEAVIQDFLTDFPESAHATEARAWLEDILLIRTRRRLSNLELRPNKDAANDGEKLYLEARRFEKDEERLGGSSASKP